MRCAHTNNTKESPQVWTTRTAQVRAQNKEFTQLEARQQEGAMAAAAPPTTLGLTDEKTEQLRKLGELKKEGILTYEEFVVKKLRLLS